MWAEIVSLVSDIGAVAKSANEVLDTVKKVKETFRAGPDQVPQPIPAVGAAPVSMQPFQPQEADPFRGGGQFLGPLQSLAAQQTSAWVPAQTQGLSGIDLTGLWVPPANPIEQTYVRQFGVYLNLVTGMGLTMGSWPILFSEGVFDPVHLVVHVVGRFANGAPLEVRAQLFPNWTLQGMLAQMGPFGLPINQPIILSKVA